MSESQEQIAENESTAPSAQPTSVNQDQLIMAQEQEIADEIKANIPMIGERTDLQRLHEEFAHDEAFSKKIESLRKDFPNMRRTRPDGNCFLRGFIYAYLEHCINIKTELERFKALIVKSKDKLIKLGFPAFTTEDFHNMFVEVLTDIEATPTIECLHKNLNDSGISDYIVVYLRLLISAYLQENAEFFTFFIEGGRTVEEFRKQEVEPMYRECDHLHIVALTSSLSVPVCVMYLDRGEQDKAATHTFPEETSKAVLHLLYRPGHYDIIYKK